MQAPESVTIQARIENCARPRAHERACKKPLSTAKTTCGHARALPKRAARLTTRHSRAIAVRWGLKIRNRAPGERAAGRQTFASIVHRFLIFCLFLFCLAAGVSTARAVEAVRVPPDAQAIDLTQAVEHYKSTGDAIQVSTAPGADGIVRRIEVRAKEAGTQPSWIVLALTNDTGEQIERLLVAPHFRLVGSGVIWPDLGATRISAITPSRV